MRHLKDDELVDLVEGQLAAARARHADECAHCRAKADACRAMLTTTGQDAVPEPSPLFWQHFSARVAGAIRAEPEPAASWMLWLRNGRVQWAAAAAALVLVTGLTWRTITKDAGNTSRQEDRVAAVNPAVDLQAADPVADDTWDLIVMATDDLALEDTENLGIRVRPGSAERLAEDLTDAERVELARLIEDELKRTGA